MTDYQKGFPRGLVTFLGAMLLTLLLLSVGVKLAHGQNAVLMPLPEQPFSYNGAPLANGFVYTYYSGGFSPAPNYTDYTGLTQNTNPVVLNAGGFPTTSLGAQTGIWLAPGTLYRIVVQNAGHVQIYQIDGVAGLVPSVTTGSVAAVTATAPIASSGGSAPNISASVSGNGSNVATTNVSSTTANDITTWDGSGNIQDSGTLLSSLAPKASPTFTGTVTIPSNTIPATVLTGGSNGQCVVKTSGAWGPGSCSGQNSVISARITSDVGVIATTTNILSIAVAASATYSFSCWGGWYSASGTIPLQIGVQASSAFTAESQQWNIDYNTTGGTTTSYSTSVGAQFTSSTPAANNVVYPFQISGFITVNGSAQNLLLTVTNNSISHAVDVAAGTFCTIYP